MKNQVLVSTITAVFFSALVCVAGYKIGHKNGFIEASSQVDGPFWNLLFLQSQPRDVIIEFNEESLLAPLVSLNHQLNDPFVSGENKKKIEYMILAAKDYVKHLKKSSSQVKDFDFSDLSVEPDLYLNDTKIPSDYFSQIAEEQKRIFAEVWDEDSYVLDAILDAKTQRQNQSVQTTATGGRF